MEQIKTLGAQVATLSTPAELSTQFTTLKKHLIKENLLSIPASYLNPSNPDFAAFCAKLQVVQHTYEQFALKAITLLDFPLFEKMYTLLQPFYVDVLAVSRDTVTKTATGENENRFKILSTILLLHLTQRSADSTNTTPTAAKTDHNAKIATPLTSMQKFYALIQRLTLSERENKLINTVITINDSLSQGNFISFASNQAVLALNEQIPGSKTLTDQLWHIVLTRIALNVEAAHKESISEPLLQKIYNISPQDFDFMISTRGWVKSDGKFVFPARNQAGDRTMDDNTNDDEFNKATKIQNQRNLHLVKEIIGIAKQSEKIV